MHWTTKSACFVFLYQYKARHIGTKKLKKPIQTMLGAALFSNAMGTAIPTNVSSVSNTTTTGLSHTTSMATTLNPYDVSTTAVFNATEAHPYACKNASIGIDMLNVKRGPYGMTPLMDAAADGCLEDLKSLIQKKAGLNVKDNNGRTALMYAVQSRRVDAVRLLLEESKSLPTTGVFSNNPVDQQNHEGFTALIQAVVNNEKVMVEELLKCCNPNLEIKDDEGHTALQYAAIFGHVDILKLLIDKKSNLETRDKEQRTPLISSVIQVKEIEPKTIRDTIALLIKSGAVLDAQSDQGVTPLMHAVKNNVLDIATLLIDSKANLDVQDGRGRTALVYAADTGINAVKLLIERKADMDIKDNEGKTLLMRVVIQSKADVVKELIGNKAKLDVQDSEGKTALIHAVIHNNIESARELIAKKANKEIMDRSGNSAFSYASDAHNIEIMKLLSSS
ncbi:ankyrin repeat domain-containing protein [Candidatus Cardinium hertigii]|uniref:ankyrin repeat domain-containing protein n=1 Tax=Candidatus Cardinium hertigii TaxID=247481 RepID=UPI003D7EBC4D